MFDQVPGVCGVRWEEDLGKKGGRRFLCLDPNVGETVKVKVDSHTTQPCTHTTQRISQTKLHLYF